MQRRHDEKNFIIEKWNSSCPSYSQWLYVLLEVQHCTLEENPLHSNPGELTHLAFLYSMCPFLCSKGMGGEMMGGGGGSEQSKLYSDPFSFPVNSKNLTYVSESVNYWLCILSKPSATWWKMLIIQIVPCLQYQCTFPDLAHFEHI